MKALLMARFTFREALHRRVLHGVLLLTAAFLLLYGLGAWLAFRELAVHAPNPGFARMLGLQYTLLGQNAVSMIGALLAVFLSVGTISSEIDAGTLHSIVPKPLHRRDVLLGKWLGFAAMLSLYVFLLSISAGAIVVLFGGQWSNDLIIAAVPMVLQALVLLSLAMLGTTFLPTVANGVMVFGLYATALMSGFVEQLGSIIRNEAMINVGIAVSLLVPSDAMAKLSAAILQRDATYIERAGPFMVNSEPSVWMVAYAVGYMAVVLLAAHLIFTRRDL
jgi:Cu-processing system permease protein